MSATLASNAWRGNVLQQMRALDYIGAGLCGPKPATHTGATEWRRRGLLYGAIYAKRYTEKCNAAKEQNNAGATTLHVVARR